MNLPSEFELIQMENRALPLDALETALIEKRSERTDAALPEWIALFFDEEDAAASAKAIRELVAIVRSLRP